jgi:hypothetical protein
MTKAQQRLIYAVQQRDYRDFELVRPHLARHMAEAYDVPDNHRLLRLRANPQAQLRIDYDLFRLLHQAEQGLPALLLQPDLTRRIWQFLEQLTDRARPQDRDVNISILDTATGEQLMVTVDTEEKAYVTIQQRER